MKGYIAQLVEHRTFNPLALGSSPNVLIFFSPLLLYKFLGYLNNNGFEPLTLSV